MSAERGADDVEGADQQERRSTSKQVDDTTAVGICNEPSTGGLNREGGGDTTESQQNEVYRKRGQEQHGTTI